MLVAVGAICVLVSLGLCAFAGSEEDSAGGFRVFFHSYLANYMFCLSICLGALFFVMVQHLARADIRRDAGKDRRGQGKQTDGKSLERDAVV